MRGSFIIMQAGRARLASGVSDDALLATIRQRSRPRVILLDDDLQIAFADADAAAMLQQMSPPHEGPLTHLPPEVASIVRGCLDSWNRHGETNDCIVPIDSRVVMRITRLLGEFGSLIVLLLDAQSRREDLSGPAKRFSFTAREVQVLALILRGLSALEIAEELGISETTVAVYFKNLMRKTDAKNRADMLAKVMGWQG